jgi:hypothetical protein
MLNRSNREGPGREVCPRRSFGCPLPVEWGEERTPKQIGKYRPIRDGYRELYSALHKDYVMFTKRRCRTQYAENEVGCACGCACGCTCKCENMEGLERERMHDVLLEYGQALADLDTYLQ